MLSDSLGSDVGPRATERGQGSAGVCPRYTCGRIADLGTRPPRRIRCNPEQIRQLDNRRTYLAKRSRENPHSPGGRPHLLLVTTVPTAVVPVKRPESPITC